MIKLRVHLFNGGQTTFRMCREMMERLEFDGELEEQVGNALGETVEWVEEWRETNAECLTRIMEHSEHGGLMQGFIMQALTEYSKEVINAPLPPERNEDGSVPFISPIAWRNCALELKDELDKFYS